MTVLVFFADLSAPAAISLGVCAAATVSIPALLLADAHRSDFDPRPWLGRAGDRLLVEAVNAHYLLRDAAITAAALLALLTITPGDAR